MRRFVNVAKSGRLAATRRLAPPPQRPLAKGTGRPLEKRGSTGHSNTRGKRRA